MSRLSCAVLIASLIIFMPMSGFFQDMSQYESLKEPRIITKLNQNMLVVEAKGDPNIVGADAFGLLFKTFFSLKGVKMAPPRARWMNPLTDPKEEWVGFYALPLPESIQELPADTQGVKIEEWIYGEVVEILHIGAYTAEEPTVEKMRKYIQEKGYEIAGPHEEEYLKGPPMVSDPSEYWTIIRYQVKKIKCNMKERCTSSGSLNYDRLPGRRKKY